MSMVEKRLQLARPAAVLPSTATSANPRRAWNTGHGPGNALTPDVRAFMESRFDREFSQVRVHTGAAAAASAERIGARAYTVGQNMVFASGQYRPETPRGRQLLAHELAHAVQQEAGGSADVPRAESRAAAAADRVARHEPVTPDMIGAAPPGLYTQEEEGGRRIPSFNIPPLRLSWDELLRPNAFQLPAPSLTLPEPRRPSLGDFHLRRPMLPPPGLEGFSGTGSLPALTPPLRLGDGGSAALTQPPAVGANAEAETPRLPSRITIANSGRFSLGLRLGFPELGPSNIPGPIPLSAPTALQNAEIMHQTLTGHLPSNWERIDKGQLAQAVWGIFSRYIAPDAAGQISSALSRPGPAGLSLELDLILLGDFNGGGISFTIQHP